VSLKTAVVTPKLIAIPRDSFTGARRTLTARIVFAYLCDCDTGIAKREFVAVSQLAVRPEGVRLLVYLMNRRKTSRFSAGIRAVT